MRGKCTPAHCRPSDTRRGISTVCGDARAIPSTGADVWGQSSPKASGSELTRSFAEAWHARWSVCAESRTQHDPATGGRRLHADILGPSEGRKSERRRKALVDTPGNHFGVRHHLDTIQARIDSHEPIDPKIRYPGCSTPFLPGSPNGAHLWARSDLRHPLVRLTVNPPK